MPGDVISQKIIHYLNTPTPSYAVLLRGEWGVGKSFYWRSFKESALPKDKRDITFSVAGLFTLEELERSLFIASIKDFGPGLLQETGTVVGRALLRLVKVEPGDIKLKADVKPGRTVICIDDIERFGGDFKVLFGFIVSLLDDAKLHVILIADEERALALEGYREYKERIISRSFDVPRAVRSFYENVINDYQDNRIRKAFHETEAYALELFEEKHVRNLRTVRAILDEMNDILSGLKWPQSKPASLSRLFSAVTFHVMAMSKNPAHALQVRHAFLQNYLGLALALNRNQKRQKLSEENDGEDAGVGDLIQKLGFELEAYQWPVSHGFAAYVSGNDYAPDDLAREFELFSNVTKEDRSLLDQFRNYRTMRDEEFQLAKTNLRNAVVGRELQSLQEIWRAYELFYHLSQQQLTAETPDQCQDLFLKAVNGYTVEDIQAGLEIWPEIRDEKQEEFIKALRKLETEVRNEERKALSHQLQRAIIEGEGEDPREVHHTPFANENPSDIYERLLAEGRPGIRRMTNFFLRRLKISNIAEYAALEAPFAINLADLLDTHTQSAQRPITLDQAALLELADVLRRFALAIKRWQTANAKNPEHPQGNSGYHE